MSNGSSPRRAWARIAVLFLLAAILAYMGACAALRTQDSALAKAAAPALQEGDYLVNVTLEGGSGRATVDSPAQVNISNGEATATIVWSSPNYDYMIVDGATYLPTNTEDNSTFQIPVLAWDEPFEVIGDTTAMSQPHEVTYQLTFDSASATLANTSASGDAGSPTLPLGVIAFCAAAAGGASVLVLKRWRASQE